MKTKSIIISIILTLFLLICVKQPIHHNYNHSTYERCSRHQPYPPFKMYDKNGDEIKIPGRLIIPPD